LLDFFKKPIFIIILAVALIVAGVWAYISDRNFQKAAEQEAAKVEEAADTAPIISNLTNIDPTTLDSGIAEQITIADGKASEFDKRFQLAAVEIRLESSLDVGGGDSTYAYTSTSDKVNNWLVTVSNSSGKFVRSRTPKEDYLGDLTAINRSFWKINYPNALQIAEKNGGLDFRNSNEIFEVRLTLKNGEPKGWLYWFVNYFGKSNVKEIQIDAGNGSIVAPASE